MIPRVVNFHVNDGIQHRVFGWSAMFFTIAWCYASMAYAIVLCLSIILKLIKKAKFNIMLTMLRINFGILV